MIKLTNVNKYYNKRKENENHVINNTSLELPDKGLVTLLGPSGCGKTTLLNTIGGLDRVDSGEIYIDGQLLAKKSNGRNDEIRNAYIGYIFQNFNLIEDKTVFENVEIVLRMMGIRDREEIQRRVIFILERVAMHRYKNRPVRALSGGQRQRVAIARALVKSPKIIIADEPTGNLDSQNTVEIMNIIKSISKDKLVLLVTHERELAEFYADQIIEIRDGTVVSNQPNDQAQSLAYDLDNKIYLKDMATHMKFQQDGVKIDYYTDGPASQVNIRVVVKNNNVYIQLPEEYRQGAETTQLVDDHYKEITRDVYEDYSFDYDQVKGTGQGGKIAYTSISGWGSVIKEGFRKVFSYSAIKKILLLGFVFAAMLTMYSVSTISATRHVEDSDFLTSHRDTISVQASNLSVDVFERFAHMDGVDYALPGSGKIMVNLPLDDFYQSARATAGTEGAIADKNLLKESLYIAGEYPKKEKEVALDKMIIDNFLKEQETKQVGVDKYEDFVGRKVCGDFTIASIVDTGSPACYMDKKEFYNILLAYGLANDNGNNTVEQSESEKDIGVMDYHSSMDSGEISLKTGSLPGDYEVMVPYEYYGTYYVGSKTDKKVNGEILKVSGFYDSKSFDPSTSYVNTATFQKAFIENQKNLVIMPKDKEQMISNLQAQNLPYVDVYQQERDTYINDKKSQMFSSLMVSLIILIISIIEIYLILRASFLSRIKEVGVLRAIGLKKKDVYKMFIGEIIAMTTLTSVPAFIVTGYFIAKIQSLPYVGATLRMTPSVAIISVVIIFTAHLVFGLVPVANTMRKTPAEILARTDVN